MITDFEENQLKRSVIGINNTYQTKYEVFLKGPDRSSDALKLR